MTAAAAGILIVPAVLRGRGFVLPARASWLAIFTYPVWGFIQQYALQGYLHRGLRRALHRPGAAAILSALIFASLHYPNPVLMAATAICGYAWCRLYARRPNLFTLGLSHGWLAVLLSVTVPDAWVHNLRVGPGYWSYRP